MISELDSQRFGIKISKKELNCLDDLLKIEEYARNNKVRMVIARGSAKNLDVVQDAIRKGFVLMDTLAYYSYSYSDHNALWKKEGGDTNIRLAEIHDAEDVKRIASEAFCGYQGHYHADQNLLSKSCDDIYADWAFRSCLSKEVADAVLLNEDEDGISAFGTLKYDKEIRVLQGPLFAVHPRARGRGVFRSLLESAKKWGSKHNAVELHYSTQITNIIVQQTLCKEGFVPMKYEYTLHKWYKV